MALLAIFTFLIINRLFHDIGQKLYPFIGTFPPCAHQGYSLAEKVSVNG